MQDGIYVTNHHATPITTGRDGTLPLRTESRPAPTGSFANDPYIANHYPSPPGTCNVPLRIGHPPIPGVGSRLSRSFAAIICE